MAITKENLAENLVSSIGINKREAIELVEVFFDEIRNILKSGQEIKVSGLGNFYLTDKKQRIGRNPKNLKEAVIPARRVVTFRTGPTAKTKMKSYAKSKPVSQ